MEYHIYIPGFNNVCWACHKSRSQHPDIVDHPAVIRRPSRMDRVQGGQLPRFEVRS
jgi:hypothetical protein